MHDIISDQHFECFEQILKVLQCLILCEMSLLTNKILKGASITVLINKIDIVGSFEDFDEFDNVSGVFYLGEGLDFVNGELF